MSRRSLYLICYDIRDPRRLARVASYLCRVGHRVQYSVFAAELSHAALEDTLADLIELIETRDDDVRAYSVPLVTDITLLGRQVFPEDIILVQNGRNLLQLQRCAPQARRKRGQTDKFDD
jgi:CRISPR-associated protein Cas2